MKCTDVLSWSLVFWTLCGCRPHSNDAASSRSENIQHLQGTNLTVEQLRTLIHFVKPWTTSGSETGCYTRSDWDRITNIAKQFQIAGDQRAAEAFGKFESQITNNFQIDYFEDSKAFLLIRVIFDLPEHADQKERMGSGWLTLSLDLNSDGSVNLSWPIQWNGGNPSLFSKLPILYRGSSYDPKSEYLYCSTHFKKRDLFTYRGPDSK